ncbi:hypothetical protein EXN66_Car019828 [Channa argus]|uniref:Uncharacterized protein n=1 Tax=Channa argus TaxID=215402 RepID=A0A6G1QN45_CHAAH|nr:hypothetical protein EXN66_Car019828 [Channa argus]
MDFQTTNSTYKLSGPNKTHRHITFLNDQHTQRKVFSFRVKKAMRADPVL